MVGYYNVQEDAIMCRRMVYCAGGNYIVHEDAIL